MKRICILLSLFLCLSPLTLAEEAFFEEVSFGGASLDDAFFEESAFSDEDFFAADEADAALPEEALLPDEDAEGRSLVMTYTKNEIYDLDLSVVKEGWMSPVGNVVAVPVSKKPNQVKLTWDHINFLTGKPITKLPKNVTYVVYELSMDTDMQRGNYAWLEVGRTTKKSIVLKNQTAGEHRYFVRTERIQGRKETYGLLSKATSPAWAFVTNSVMWKTISRVALREERDGAYTYIRVSFVTKEFTSDQSFKCTWRYKKGKKWISHSMQASVGGSTVYEKGVPTYHFDNFAINVTDCVNDGAKQIEVIVTPYNAPFIDIGTPGKPKKAVLKLSTDYSQLAPLIVGAVRTNGGITLTWRDKVPVDGNYYEIYDGKTLAQRVYSTSDPYGLRSAFVPAGPGTHKLKVRRVSLQDDKFTYKCAFSGVKSVVIPKAINDCPVITKATVNNSSGYVNIEFVCQNPDVYEFYVYASDRWSSSALYDPIDLTETGYRYYPAPGTDPSGSAPEYVHAVMAPGYVYSCGHKPPHMNTPSSAYFVVVQGVTPDGKVFTSDVIRLSSSLSTWNSANSLVAPDQVVQLKR